MFAQVFAHCHQLAVELRMTCAVADQSMYWCVSRPRGSRLRDKTRRMNMLRNGNLSGDLLQWLDHRLRRAP